MTPSSEATMPATRRTRKSIGSHLQMKRTMDKENATVDVASTLADNRKKSRSKSIGPGGLDTLKSGSGNRRVSLAPAIKQPRSILKPTMYSVQEIPPLKSGKQRRSSLRQSRDSSKTMGTANDDSMTGSRIALRTEEQQQAAAREREERERRDARRKSLANRRVSFAAEATLHTFHEMDFLQDTTSSTDSTRRASTAKASELSGNVPKSPDNQDANKRNSGLPPVNFGNTDDDTVTSTIYSSDSEPADAVEEVDEEEEEEDDSGSSSDSDDGTMMTIETEDITGTTVASERYGSDNESSTLDRALRMASQRAGTQNVDRDQDNEELDDGEEIIPSFGWVKKTTSQISSTSGRGSLSGRQNDGTEMDIDMHDDMDMTASVGRILKPQDNRDPELDEDMSMEVTQAIGGILFRKQNALSNLTANQDDSTMELTTAIGGIHHPQITFHDEFDTNEDFSMEFTAAMGGVLPQRRIDSSAYRPQLNSQGEEDIGDATMDMTVGFGNIVSHSTQENDDSTQTEKTMGMDITVAIGGILEAENTIPSSPGKVVAIEQEAEKLPSPKRSTVAVVSQKTPTRRSARLSGMSQVSSPTRKLDSIAQPASNKVEPQTPDTMSSPLRTPMSSPPKPSTLRAKSVSPGILARGSRSKSPRSITSRAKTSVKAVESPFSSNSIKPKLSLFHDDVNTGLRTPVVLLTPQTRRLSGMGVDKSGLGSPQVTALFERRTSLGESANDFVSGKRDVAFESPRAMEEEIDKEREDEEAKENQRRVVEREVNFPREDRDATLNLREMIDSLDTSSPKKAPLKGRKSLHLGSAKGLLGKRPAELDDDEDSEEDVGIKRLKGHQGSPVKNIKLQQPPSVAETTGRLTRLMRKSPDFVGDAAGVSYSSPLKATSPRNQPGLDNFRINQTVHEVNFQQSHDKGTEELEHKINDERIQLQDFLNMTSIRFMELTTTKRRHTVAPNNLENGLSPDEEDAMTLERCVVAGACTIPMLELYQHSCRELKNYIAEGRRMVKEIEEETLEDNPPLFREYMTATADVKALMDNQFKNVKTHARLLSKAMWYEWRMKLQYGLREGLLKISEDMESDSQMLKDRENLLEDALPNIVSRCEALEEESCILEAAAQDLADCDPAELQVARDDLIGLDADIKEKKSLIADLRQQLEASTKEVETLSDKKEGLLSNIQQTEKIREACRGWTATEVESIKGRVDAIEKQSGWAVTGFSGTNLSMTYKREIEIVFDIVSFQPHQANSRIDLWYIGAGDDGSTAPKTAEREFFLQCIRDHVRALTHSETKVFDLLETVRRAWDMARVVSDQIGMASITFPTTVTKTSDSSVAVTSSLLLKPLRTRVETTLHLFGQSVPKGLDVGISTQVKVIYGEHFNVSKVGEFLATKIGNKIGAKEDYWSDVLVELEQRLIARGKKQASMTH